MGPPTSVEGMPTAHTVASVALAGTSPIAAGSRERWLQIRGRCLQALRSPPQLRELVSISGSVS